MVALCNTADHYIFALWFLSSFFFFISSPNLSGRSCTRFAENTGCKNRHFGIIAQLCRAVSSQLRHVSTIGKNVTSSTCPHNMANFGLLTAEIRWRVWGTPANLAALLHGTLVVGASQTAALNRGRHLCSAGRPSRWALAHILVFIYY